MMDQIWNEKSFWLVKMILVALLVVCANIALGLIFNRVIKTGRGVAVQWFKDLVRAIKLPVYYFIWTILVLYCAKVLSDKFIPQDFVFPSNMIAKFALIFFGFWGIFRWKKLFLKSYVRKMEKQGDEHHLYISRVIDKLLTITIIIIAILMTLDLIGVKLTALLAFGGMGGIAVGFAAKDIISNIFGGLMIYFTHPFSVGDRICSADRKLDGFVERIGWYQTKLYSYDRQPLYVPNSLFSTIIISNPSRMYHRCFKETIGIRYDDYDKLKVILDKIRKFLDNYEHVDKNQNVEVFFQGYGSYTLDIWVVFYTLTTSRLKYLAIKEEVLIAIGDIIAGEGAEFAFPTSTSYLITSQLTEKK